jgi:hypothetical protein
VLLSLPSLALRYHTEMMKPTLQVRAKVNNICLSKGLALTDRAVRKVHYVPRPPSTVVLVAEHSTAPDDPPPHVVDGAEQAELVDDDGLDFLPLAPGTNF